MAQILGIIARAIIVNKTRDKILLVKNKDGVFWYPPGGNWEPEYEPKSIGRYCFSNSSI